MLDHYWENAGRANNKGGIYFAIDINFAQIYPACLQGEDVFPFEKNQGKKAYAIFGDAAAMLRHGVKNVV